MSAFKMASKRDSEVGLIADVLKEVPAAATYKAALENLEQDNERLKAENEALRQELGQVIDRWETLDGDAVNALVYLSQNERGNAMQIAETYSVNIQIAETYLKQLALLRYVHTHANGEAPHDAIAHKGRWYLSERGLLKTQP